MTQELILTPQTDAEIEEQAMLEWGHTLAFLWTAIGKPIDTKQLQSYRRSLSIVPIGLLEHSLDRLVREYEYNNVPPIGRIWKAIREELEHQGYYVVGDVSAAIERWKSDSFERVLIRF